MYNRIPSQFFKSLRSVGQGLMVFGFLFGVGMLSIPSLTHAQYLMDMQQEQDVGLSNNDSDPVIPVIVIPDGSSSSLGHGGCGAGCRPGASSASSSPSTHSTSSSTSSRTPRLPVTIPPHQSAPAQRVTPKPVSAEVLAMQKRALARRSERIKRWLAPALRAGCDTLRTAAASVNMNMPHLFLFTFAGLCVPLLVGYRRARKNTKKKSVKNKLLLFGTVTFRKKKRDVYVADILAVFLVMSMTLAMLIGLSPQANAASTVPAYRVFSSKLTNSSGTPITSQQSIRFSYWRGGNSVPTDFNPDGTINASAPNFTGWQETHTVTPTANGGFTVELGSISGGVDLTTMTQDELRNLQLQVEVKPAAAPNTSFFLIDPFPNDALRDRSAVFAATFAQNADLLDQHDVSNTGSGSIPFLMTGGVLKVSTIPNGTNADFFTIDADNSSATNVTLQFGQSLSKTLKYNKVSNRFEFNDDVYVQGNLTVTGLINGVDITSITGQAGALKASSGGGLNIAVSGGNYRLNGIQTAYPGGILALPNGATSYVYFGTGGLTSQLVGFPTTKSFIPVAQVVTAAGAIVSITDKRIATSDDREIAVKKVLNPDYPNVIFQADATQNVGQMSVTHDDTAGVNFYRWSSTRASLQDYDIVVHVPLSGNFARWKTGSMKVFYRSTSASTTNSKLDITVFDTNGSPVTLTGTSTDLASTSWASTTLNFAGSPTWTPGQSFVIKLKTSAKDLFEMHVGAIELQTEDLLQK